MQVRSQLPQGETVAPKRTAERPAIPGAIGHRRTPSSMFAGVILCLTLLGLAAAGAMTRGDLAHRTTMRPAAQGPNGVSGVERIGSPRTGTALKWVEGLANASILPSDVTRRLRTVAPKTARMTMAAWSDLTSAGGQTQMHTALKWVEGLADGSILTSDVTHRLDTAAPKTARAVMAAWSDLDLGSA